MNSREVVAFRKIVWNNWKRQGRHGLPWRKTKDAYRILVSEVMLQQTQVPRVIPKYKEFIKKFPTARVLAAAALGDVLKVWSGLGYNRRAKHLHDAAKVIVEKHGGRVPPDAAALRALPGIGPYTASAVRTFAFNEPDVLIETNIRTALIHHFFRRITKIDDRTILLCAQETANEQDPREWNWALMDYGAHLKQSGVRVNALSAHYVKQTKFEGSMRQLRGGIIQQLHAGSRSTKQLMIEIRSQSLGEALKRLEHDGLIVKQKGKWRIV